MIVMRIRTIQIGFKTLRIQEKILLFLKNEKQTAVRRVRVKAGVSTPSTAKIPPRNPAVRSPAKVAQFRPRGPGVISAIAITLERSSAVIHL